MSFLFLKKNEIDGERKIYGLRLTNFQGLYIFYI